MRASLLVLSFAVAGTGCSSGKTAMVDPCAAAGITVDSRFPGGGLDGHPDLLGARAAKQARAGRVRDAALIKQPANAKQKITTDDFLLINDKIAVYVEAAGPSDSYMPFGGEVLAVEPVNDDGMPAGISQYGETLLGLSRQAINPDSVTVLNDGSDGKAAVVRASGRFQNIPFMDAFESLLPDEFGFPGAIDYVLEPGAEKLTIRLSLMNTQPQTVNLGTNQNIGFFHSFRNQTFLDFVGYAPASGMSPFVGFDGGAWGFAWRLIGSKMSFLIEVSGFQGFQGSGLSLDACSQKTVDYAEIIPGGPQQDGLRAAIRRVDGDTSWREVTGHVEEPGGAPVPGALVHLVAADGSYLTRTLAGSDGSFVIHAPPQATQLYATKAGYTLPPPVSLAADATQTRLELGAHGTLVVHAKDTTSGAPLPVRVQVIPSAALTTTPESFGVLDELRGRLYQEFAVTGEATLDVPAGQHRVIVSRGYEWELHDETVQVDAGKTTTVDASLLHSVDSTGVMCADFHIHSYFSADATDEVEYKVKGAVADGLEIPVSSEHEWIIDFQPVIQKLGLTQWAYGFPSEEFTTFTWGHFGVVPIRARPDKINNGAVQWVGKKPPEVFPSIVALPEQPVLIINHPSGGGFGAYFSATHFTRATAVGDPDMWSDQFGAVEVFNGSDLDANREHSVADWFALLDAGKQVWAVGNSDSHHLRTEAVGYPRTCLRFGHDDPTQLSAEVVRDTLRKGAGVVSGGLYMTVEGPGGAGPGEQLPAQAGALVFKVVVQAPSWLEASTLEVFVDGQTQQTLQLQESTTTTGPARHYEAMVTVAATQQRPVHYVVFHASAPARDLSPLDPGRKPFAVSNPIFF